jgi:cysteine desulfurase
MQNPIYLDNHASTRIDPRVLEAMQPFLNREFGNAAAVSHAYGWRAETAVEKARAEVAQLIGAEAKEIIFTSGATESNNMALKCFLPKDGKKQIVTSLIEHSSVLDTCDFLQKKGVPIAFISPAGDGVVPLIGLEKVLSAQTGLVSIMAANNEIGTINDIEAMACVSERSGAVFHSDLTQALGRIPVDVHKQKIGMASFSSHKIYGPKGVGALYVQRNLQKQIEPLIHGGKHEQGLRSGTLNVPAIVGFGAACVLMQAEMEVENQRLLKLRTRLLSQLQKFLSNTKVNGSLEKRLPGNLNISFQFLDGEQLFLSLQPVVAISRGSACSAKAEVMSHVLRSLGVSSALAQATIRFGIGRFNTEQEIDHVASVLIREVKRLV